MHNQKKVESGCLKIFFDERDGLYLERRGLDTRRGRRFEILCPLWQEFGFSISAPGAKLAFLLFQVIALRSLLVHDIPGF